MSTTGCTSILCLKPNEMSNSVQPHPAIQWRVKLRHSLRTKVLIVFLLVFSSTFLAAGIICTYGLPFGPFDGWQGHAKNEAIRSLNLVADMHKKRIEVWIRERQGNAQVIAENLLLATNIADLLALASAVEVSSEYGSGPRETQAQNTLEQATRLLSAAVSAYVIDNVPTYQSIQIVHGTSAVILVSSREADVGLPTIHRESVARVMQTRDSYISNMILDEGGLNAPVTIGYPIFNANSVPVAVVVLELNLGGILGRIRDDNVGLGRTGEVLLVDEQSHILTGLRHTLPDESVAKVFQYKITAFSAVAAASGDEGIHEGEDYRGEPVIAAYRHIRVSADWGWGLVAKIDSAELFASTNELVKSFARIGLGGIVLIALMSLMLAHRLTEPLLKMTRKAQLMLAGEKFQRTDIKSRDEIGFLSKAFNDMVESLDSSNRDLLHRSAELDAVNQELESFAYSMAHDLRSPLRAIDGFSQALVEDYGDKLEGEALTYLKYLREGSQEMGCLIDDLLKLSRATRGEMRRSNVDLSQIADEIVDALRLADPDRNVITDIAPGITVSGDARLLKVVMDNLLGNAWKFSSEQAVAHIRFVAERRNGRFRCVVQDNGVGFDMAYAGKLFQPFQRLHRREEFQGTGIGLVTAQRIIHRHGGKITAIAALGEGARFIFELDIGERNHD